MFTYQHVINGMKWSISYYNDYKHMVLIMKVRKIYNYIDGGFFNKKIYDLIFNTFKI